MGRYYAHTHTHTARDKATKWTTRRYASAVYTMALSVRPSVCLSPAGILPKLWDNTNNAAE